MHGEQHRVGVGDCVSRRARPCTASGFLGQPLELLLAARVTEDHLVSGPRQDPPELASHQSRAKYADAQFCSFQFMP
jgi:hypothetical protein